MHALAAGWFWHPLRLGNGYDFWSGIAGCFIWSVPGWIVAIVVYLRAHNCHVRGCPRLSWAAHPDHDHPVCCVHHPDGCRGRAWRLAHRARLSRDHVLDASRHAYHHHERNPT